MQSFIEEVEKENTKSFLFIDGSYFCFHRFHSIMRWWKSAYPEIPITEPITNEIFVEKFKKTFVDTLKNLIKRLNLTTTEESKPIMIVGKDCKREAIWRQIFYNEYKANRNKNKSKNNTNTNENIEAPFFAMVYKEALFQQGGVRAIVSHPNLEADDCIAISVKRILQTIPNATITIITSDKDYLQLAGPNVNIFNLAYKNITEATLGGSAEADLFCKIVMGDTSDNITSVLQKCGPKTALKCFHDKMYFEERMKKENAYEKYELNKKIIDFNCIPQNLIEEFMQHKGFITYA